MATIEQKKIANQALKLVMNNINGVKGNKTPDIIRIGFLGKMVSLNVPVVTSGSVALDLAMGVGGYPQGRLIEIYGPESCIAHQSYIPYEVWIDGKRSNHKGGSISRLYERFTGNLLDTNPKQGRHLQNNNAEFYVKAVDDEGKVIRNKILNVVKTGKKQCFTLETISGEIISCTAEHKFMTPDGFKPLSELEAGNIVFVHNNTRVKGRKEHSTRPEVYVKYHPFLPTKRVKCAKTGNTYTYFRGQKARLVYEAHINKLSYEKYIDFLNLKTIHEIGELKFIPKGKHVHHKDENFRNNNIWNLELVSPREHGILHTKDRLRNLSFIVVPSKILSITKTIETETFDIKCAYPYNNYISEGIVVHNSGKTTLCLHAIAEFQKKGLRCAFIDVEHTVDIAYAQNLGVNVDELLFSQPDDGDEAMRTVDALIKSGQVDLIIVDSIASLVTIAEMEGEATDNHIGRQARLMSQVLKRFTVLCGKTNTTVIFTNQIRMKIGVMFGNPETTSGGNAMKFYATIRLDVRRREPIKQGDRVIGAVTKVKVVKNKVAPPFKQAEFRIMYGTGIDQEADVISTAVDLDIISRAGAWYSYNGEKIGQGLNNSITYLQEHPALIKEIQDKVLATIARTDPKEEDDSDT